MRRTMLCLLVLGIVFSIAACKDLGLTQIKPAPTLTPPSPSKGCATMTCTASIDAKAWVDENANGVWDNHESPLPWVRFRIEGATEKPTITLKVIQGKSKEEGQKLEGNYTDANGVVEVRIDLSGERVDCSLPAQASCDAAREKLQTRGDIFVYPDVPVGYRLTTPPKIAVGNGQSKVFGFAPLAQIIDQTPTSSVSP